MTSFALDSILRRGDNENDSMLAIVSTSAGTVFVGHITNIPSVNDTYKNVEIWSRSVLVNMVCLNDKFSPQTIYLNDLTFITPLSRIQERVYDKFGGKAEIKDKLDFLWMSIDFREFLKKAFEVQGKGTFEYEQVYQEYFTAIVTDRLGIEEVKQ